MTGKVVYTEEIANVVADFEADAIKDRLDQIMDDAVHSLLQCGQASINMLVRAKAIPCKHRS